MVPPSVDRLRADTTLEPPGDIKIDIQRQSYAMSGTGGQTLAGTDINGWLEYDYRRTLPNPLLRTVLLREASSDPAARSARAEYVALDRAPCEDDTTQPQQHDRAGLRDRLERPSEHADLVVTMLE